MSTGVKSWISQALLSAVWCLWQATCSADLVLEVSDVSIPYGGTGFVDVFVYSNATPGDFLAAWDMTFEIIGPVTNGSLDFDSTQDISGIASPVPYVFYGNSGSYGTSSPANNPPNPDLMFSDFTGDSSDVSLVHNNRYLLARISLVHSATRGSLAIGDQFTVSLVDSSFTYDLLGSVTTTPYNPTLSFTVFVTAPEPSAIGVLLPGLGLAMWLRRRRQRIAGQSGGMD
ncbi:MAG TPA: hypothetical protein DIT89_16095 [Planctomycetaceae bacterium]|nr:hypothetical protein [Planctomycetaceae bacterium]